MAHSEEDEQAVVFEWAEYMAGKCPALRWMYHCPNGGKRDKTTAARLKHMGVKPGVPDILLPVRAGGYCGLAVELKVGNNTTTPRQDEWLAHFAEQGYRTAVCYGAGAAIDVIADYMSIKGERL